MSRARPIRMKRAFVLLLALGFSALVSLMGLSFLAERSTAVPQAINQAAAVRAEFLAGSGIALASHCLVSPPTTVTAGQHWSGGNGFTFDGTADYCDIVVSRSASDPREYGVQATGVVLDSRGQVLSKRKVRVYLLTPPPKTWNLTNAVASFKSLRLGSNLTVVGNTRTNGSIISTAPTTGTATASGTISWTSTPGPTGTFPGAVAMAFPAEVNYRNWQRYSVHGMAYQARDWSSGSLGSLAMTLSGASSRTVSVNAVGGVIYLIDGTLSLIGGLLGLGNGVGIIRQSSDVAYPSTVTQTFVDDSNPAGIIVRSGNLDISGAVTVLGTLVVNGNLDIATLGSLKIIAMPGYPALVVRGNIDVKWLGSLDVLGPVHCDGSLTGSSATKMLVNGAWITVAGGIDQNLNASTPAQITHTSGYSKMYDFSPNAAGPMTVLEWND